MNVDAQCVETADQHTVSVLTVGLMKKQLMIHDGALGFINGTYQNKAAE